MCPIYNLGNRKTDSLSIWAASLCDPGRLLQSGGNIPPAVIVTAVTISMFSCPPAEKTAQAASEPSHLHGKEPGGRWADSPDVAHFARMRPCEGDHPLRTVLTMVPGRHGEYVCAAPTAGFRVVADALAVGVPIVEGRGCGC